MPTPFWLKSKGLKLKHRVDLVDRLSKDVHNGDEALRAHGGRLHSRTRRCDGGAMAAGLSSKYGRLLRGWLD